MTFLLDHDVPAEIGRILECANILRLIAQAGEAGVAENINFAWIAAV